MSNTVKMALMFKERTGKISGPRELVGRALTPPFRFSKLRKGVCLCEEHTLTFCPELQYASTNSFIDKPAMDTFRQSILPSQSGWGIWCLCGLFQKKRRTLGDFHRNPHSISDSVRSASSPPTVLSWNNLAFPFQCSFSPPAKKKNYPDLSPSTNR